MKDLIERPAAQTELMMKCERYTLARESHGMGHVEWSSDLISVADAMDAIRDLPSAQPEPCKDAVSRADVVDMLEMFPFTEYSEYETAREVVKRLPSAQPEIIYCKDCKHYKAFEYTGRLACHYVIGGTVIRNPNDFCSRAERI